MAKSTLTQKNLPFKERRQPTCGHPDRPHGANGKCHSCYLTDWSRKHRKPGKGRVPTCGHPDRRHVGLGMCRACYTTHWQKTNIPPEELNAKRCEVYRRKRAALANDPERLERVREYGRKQSQRWRAANYDKARANERATRKRRYHSPDGKTKRAVRDQRFRAKFGITVDEYDRIHSKQGGVCAICGRAESRLLRGVVKSLAVDHCHATGKVRGLLCQACNLMIGHADDDAARLLAAARYLGGDSGEPLACPPPSSSPVARRSPPGPRPWRRRSPAR